MPVFACLCKVDEMNTPSRMSARKCAMCVTVAEAEAWFTVEIGFAAVIELHLAVEVTDLGRILSGCATWRETGYLEQCEIGCLGMDVYLSNLIRERMSRGLGTVKIRYVESRLRRCHD